jgi:ABC-type amino acid transport system permease subunit
MDMDYSKLLMTTRMIAAILCDSVSCSSANVQKKTNPKSAEIYLLLNRHPCMESILRFIPEYERQTGLKVSALMWKVILLPTNQGVLNHILGLVGIRPISWLGDSSTALISLIFIDVRIYSPFTVLILLAGLQSMPKEPYEAAQVGGASGWFMFRRLTLPLLTPGIVLVTLFRLHYRRIQVYIKSLSKASNSGVRGQRVRQIGRVRMAEVYIFDFIGNSRARIPESKEILAAYPS